MPKPKLVDEIAPSVGRVGRRCTRCIMDESAPDIVFDEAGHCNYCSDFLKSLAEIRATREEREERLDSLLTDIRRSGRDRSYDCVMGVSGGLDSSFALYRSRRLGLRPLAVHMDNGWNSELAVSNIERLVNELDVELFTRVLKWEQFRSLQRSFFAADVVDIEMLTDNAIMGALLAAAKRFGIRHVLLGTNAVTEGMRMPPGWNHFKLDLRNIRSIHRQFGRGTPITDLPLVGPQHLAVERFIRRRQVISFLDYVSYETAAAQDILEADIEWRPYEKKHYESIFTRFYQGYILPVKFGIDKRKVHYSTLICSDQLTRNEALSRMEHAPYADSDLLASDRTFVLKKLGMSSQEFDGYMERTSVSHYDYGSIEPLLLGIRRVRDVLK